MTDRVQPVEAWAAVSPDGQMREAVIGVRDKAEAEDILGLNARYSRIDWRVIRVRIVPVEGGDG